MGFVNSIINVAIPLVPENGADSALHAEDDYEEKNTENQYTIDALG